MGVSAAFGVTLRDAALSAAAPTGWGSAHAGTPSGCCATRNRHAQVDSRGRVFGAPGKIFADRDFDGSLLSMQRLALRPAALAPSWKAFASPIVAPGANTELENPRDNMRLMAGNIDWQTAHAALSRLARQRAAADAEEGRWLLAAQRLRAHVHLGMGSFVEYVERMFGYRPRTTHEKLRVAEALEHLPLLANALESGELSWSAVRELTRVAVPETEAIWLTASTAKTLRELEELVAGRHPGDLPTDAPDPRAVRHIVRFEVTAETYATLREAFTELRRRSEASLSDDALLLELARRVLGGPADEGRSSYQIALSVCPDCGAARQSAGNRSVPVDSSVVEMARCDGQCFTLEPAPASAHVDAAAPRAKQSIPPALRRAVLHRDQRRCQVPGCRNDMFLDLHHLQPRAEGGAHTASNLLTVCSTHHRALHRGELSIQRSADGTLTALHADGGRYGAKSEPLGSTPAGPSRSSLAQTVQSKVRAGLCGMGFRRTEVDRVLRELATRAELREAAPDQWLRAALLRLTRPAAQPCVAG